MAKLELSLLVGAESKEWLKTLTDVVERLENAITKTPVKTEVVEQAEQDDEGFEDAPPKKEKKKASFDDEDEDLPKAQESKAEESKAEESEDFMDAAPVKKAKKLTAEDVNAACKARAAVVGGKAGRSEVLAILQKKFKTQSISEIKEDAYAAVISAMAV